MSRAILSRRRLPESGERVGEYEVVAPVAQGGMAEVFLVRRRGLGGFERRLAMKMMHPHLAGDSSFVDMFLDEARIASCIDHPNVVSVLDVGTHDGLAWLVMEWLDGKTLADVLTHATKPSVRLRAALLAEVATGLHAAHEARGADGAELGVVHRDVSPQNVHVGYDGVVKLVDFGIAAARGRLTRTETGQVKGKVGYLAPEQLLFPNEPVDRRVDVWAFGVMAWETLALRRLFGGGGGDPATRMYQIVHASVPDLADAAPDVPDELADLVMQCLERDPKHRPGSMSDIARSLRQVAGEPHVREAIAAHMTACFAEDRRAMEEQLEGLRSARSGEVRRGSPRRARDTDESSTKVDVDAALAAAESTAVDAAAPPAAPAREPEVRADSVRADSVDDDSAIDAPRPRARRTLAWIAALAAVAAALAVGGPLVASLASSPAGADAEGTPAVAAPGAEPVAAAAPHERAIAPADTTSEPVAPADTAPADTAPADTAPADTAPADTAPADTAAPGARTVELRVARAVATVTVGGVVHDERPVRVALPESGSVEVALRARDGRRATRTIAASDDGATLDVPRRRPRATAAGEGSIWSSPYR